MNRKPVITAGRKWNNLSVVMLILVLLAGNVAFHLEARFNGAAEYSIRVGIAVVVLLISLIGGRIIPSFTRNWLVKQEPGRLPVPFARFDMLCVAAGAIALVCWILSPAIWSLVTCSLQPAHCTWFGWHAGPATGRSRERLLLILHIGYAFVPIGFLLNPAAPSASCGPAPGSTPGWAEPPAS